MLVSPTGWILDVHGPYFADGPNNDAHCIITELKDEGKPLRNWLKKGDILLVDRCYRDSLQFLDTIGLVTRMPSYLKKG